MIGAIIATGRSIRDTPSGDLKPVPDNSSSLTTTGSVRDGLSADNSIAHALGNDQTGLNTTGSRNNSRQTDHGVFEMELEPGQEDNAEALVQLITTRAPAMPMAFVADPAKMDEPQANAVKSLQDAFVNTMKQTSQNPSDPAYSAQWVVTQSELDEIFHAQFGDTAYNALLNSRSWRP